ncbi:MAG: M20/M25/M40 family metallo-hydrolase [Flavobacteriales bacterium]|nr:M20/M25/M40 family metallo-hydrolase [Flavobacteriales bacterium]
MKILSITLCLFICRTALAQDADSVMIAKIHEEILLHGACYEDLRHLCKDIGQRLAGSDNAAKAIEWGKATLSAIQPDSVYLMPVEVPHWTRGKNESGTYILHGADGQPQQLQVALTALGGSVGTQGVITAEIVEVKSFDELKALGEENVKGKIVFFNKAMDAALINTGAAYGGAYPIRGQGPSEAAKYGAVACLIRSLTLADDNYPHTGATRYEEGVHKIPAAALSAVASRQLSKDLKSNPGLKFSLQLSCEAFPRTMQANVIAELRGKDFPDEYITIGGHLDSWDIGEGAHDDGAGIVQSIEVLRALRALGYQPRHTIRIVLFINEEFGNDGGTTYAQRAREKDEIHVAALESDAGGFSPNGFDCDISDDQYEILSSWAPLFDDYNLFRFRRGGSGVDIRPLKGGRVALFGLLVDGQRYFDYHHSNNDVFENVNRRELELGAAAMASLVFMIDQTGIPMKK